MKEFSHFSKERANMVSITQKKKTHRIAIARATLQVSSETIDFLKKQKIPKGDAFTISKVAAIQSAKKVADFIPLCHPINLENIEVDINIVKKEIRIQTQVESFSKTGVEMEALFALSTACLTLYDMCKSVDKKILILKQGLYKKSGGKSGDFFNLDLKWDS